MLHCYYKDRSSSLRRCVWAHRRQGRVVVPSRIRAQQGNGGGCCRGHWARGGWGGAVAARGARTNPVDRTNDNNDPWNQPDTLRRAQGVMPGHGPIDKTGSMGQWRWVSPRPQCSRRCEHRPQISDTRGNPCKEADTGRDIFSEAILAPPGGGVTGREAVPSRKRGPQRHGGGSHRGHRARG